MRKWSHGHWPRRRDAGGRLFGGTIAAVDYLVVPVPNPATLKQALSAAWGVLATVLKRREVHLLNNVRIHFDDVERLGKFLELKAVLGPDIDDAAGNRQVAELRERCGIAPSDLLSGSYVDLIRALSGGAT